MKTRALMMSLLVIVLVLGLFAVPAMAGDEVYPPTPPVTPPVVTPPAPPQPPVSSPPPVTPPSHPVTGVDALFLALAGGALLGLGTVAVRGVKRPVPQG
jgi:hypothetical protein